MKNPIKVVVADDDAFVRAGVKLYLEPVVEKIKIIGYAADGIQTIDAVKSLQPDILLLDLQMPRIVDPWNAIEQLINLYLNLKIIVLRAHEEIDYVSKALAAEARRYLTKSSLEQELWWAIQLVASDYSAIKYDLLAQTLSIKSLSNPVISQVKYPTKPRKRQVSLLVLANKSFIILFEKIRRYILNDESKQKINNMKQKINAYFIKVIQFKFTLKPIHIIILFCCSLSLTILVSAVMIALK